MPKVITIIQNRSTKDKDLLTLCIEDLITGKNKVRFDCHLSSLLDIVSSNLMDL